MSNVLGTINPVAEPSPIWPTRPARGAGRRLPGRGAHADPDVKALDADFYVCTGHKLYGPTGIGVLYGKAEPLAALPPYQGGGEMIETVTEEARHLCRAAACGSRPARRRSWRPSAWAPRWTG
jgi:cysteine desulfurase/selenocysteine lyase